MGKTSFRWSTKRRTIEAMLIDSKWVSWLWRKLRWKTASISRNSFAEHTTGGPQGQQNGRQQTRLEVGKHLWQRDRIIKFWSKEWISTSHHRSSWKFMEEVFTSCKHKWADDDDRNEYATSGNNYRCHLSHSHPQLTTIAKEQKM